LIPVDQKPWLDQAARNASYMLASNIHPKVVQEPYAEHAGRGRSCS
jgi:hypothetical protein